VKTVLIIAGDTVRSIRRHRVLLAFLLLSTAGVALAGVGIRSGMREMDRTARINAQSSEAAGASAESPAHPAPAKLPDTHQMIIMMNGLFVWMMSLIGSLLALGLFCTVISSEIQTGTIRVTMAKPVPRWAYLVGRWLGAAIILAAYGVIAGIASAVLGAMSDVSAVTALISMAWLTFCGNLVLGTVGLAFSLYVRGPVAAVLAWFASAVWFQQSFFLSVALYSILPSYEPFDVSRAMMGLSPMGLRDTVLATLYAADVVVIATLLAFARFRRMELAGAS